MTGLQHVFQIVRKKVVVLAAQCVDETHSMVSIYDRSYLQLSWRTARTKKKKETLKLYVSGSGWCIIEHIGCVKAVKPSIADHV